MICSGNKKHFNIELDQNIIQYYMHSSHDKQTALNSTELYILPRSPLMNLNQST